jgi:IPT/TIG domain
MFNRYLARVVTACIVGFAGFSLACGDSPSSPTPTAPAPAPSAVPAPAPAPSIGFTLRSVTPSSGPTIGGDFIRIAGDGFQLGATVMIDGAAARVTKVTGTVIDARTQAHETGTVDVVVMNPDGQTKTLPGSYTFGVFSVSGSPSLVVPGSQLTVSWVAPSGRGCVGGGDWIAIYKVGDPDQTGAANGHSDLWYDHVCGATSGSRTLSAPAQPGEYEFRFLVGDFSAARSNPITVRETTAFRTLGAHADRTSAP